MLKAMYAKMGAMVMAHPAGVRLEKLSGQRERRKKTSVTSAAKPIESNTASV